MDGSVFFLRKSNIKETSKSQIRKKPKKHQQVIRLMAVIIELVKIESAFRIKIFSLKMIVKNGLEISILKSLLAEKI